VFYDTFGPRFVNGLKIQEFLAPEVFHIAPTGSGLTWTGGAPLTDSDRAGRSIIGLSHNITYTDLTTEPSAGLAYIDCCNASNKAPLTFTAVFTPETVLFSPPRVESVLAYVGGLRYSAAYSHKINPFGWNKFWRAATNGWEFLYLPNGDRYVPHPVTW